MPRTPYHEKIVNDRQPAGMRAIRQSAARSGHQARMSGERCAACRAPASNGSRRHRYERETPQTRREACQNEIIANLIFMKSEKRIKKLLRICHKRRNSLLSDSDEAMIARMTIMKISAPPHKQYRRKRENVIISVKRAARTLSRVEINSSRRKQ